VLFVIEDSERNVIDQKLIETDLHFRHGIKSMRCTFKQIGENMEFDNNTHILKVMGKEIGFVYYRCGYQLE
jgi:6-phosphofructokinase